MNAAFSSDVRYIKTIKPVLHCHIRNNNINSKQSLLMKWHEFKRLEDMSLERRKEENKSGFTYKSSLHNFMEVCNQITVRPTHTSSRDLAGGREMSL